MEYYTQLKKNVLRRTAEFLNAYEAKPQEYKDSITVDAFCLPFDAFPIQGMNYRGTKFGA
jgi:hypothetical protein